MKVDKGRLIYDIFEQNKIQYSVPVYQRNCDWAKLVVDTNQQLYKKYSLTTSKVFYIEKTVKAMG